MSTLFSLNTHDFIKGLALTIIAAVGTTLADALNVPGFNLQWAEVARVALVAGLSYLVKNFSSDSNGRLLGKI